MFEDEECKGVRPVVLAGFFAKGVPEVVFLLVQETSDRVCRVTGSRL